MNWVVVMLGLLLIVIGFATLVGPSNLPSSMILPPGRPFTEIGFDARIPRSDLDSPTPRRKVALRLVVGLSLMVIGVGSIVLWH
jgi:hypothetical protein